MIATVDKVKKILESKFDIQNYVELVQEVFASVKLVAPDNFHKEYSNFSTHIEKYSHVGKYEDAEGKTVAMFAVELKLDAYVKRSRSTQRSFAKKLIENGNCDAAFIAFYTPGDDKWRLSLVRLDYELTVENGSFKTAENITPAKRYSYLVGEKEPSYTAIDRFRKFILDKNSQPTLDEIEEAFSVEKVTKEFFDLYLNKFLELKEHLDSNPDFTVEAAEHNFTSEQFAKKLMGQIVFLYFLQKKGWLGVGVWSDCLSEKDYNKIFYTEGARGRIIKQYLPLIYAKQGDGTYLLSTKMLDQIPDEAEELIANSMPSSKNWGEGSQKFLSTLFKYAKGHKGHFFENYLEPLFYDTLNQNRGEKNYCPALHCRIPFLSGGLFEPIDGYDWKINNFDIPDEMFSSKADDNDSNGTGILDIFDRYNFTICEDEPLEKEVAIDPEMLGKIFENLLEIKDRKSKGAFYTPREIVHYMCQESLINYIANKTSMNISDIREFIIYGDFMKDEDTIKQKREGNGSMYIPESIFKVDANGNIVVNRLKDIDDALKSVRVADPAVGSGAFPLGMLNEIVRARENLTEYMAIGMNAYESRMLHMLDRHPYNLKLNAIQNSIFAVDIEPSAVDIAQLRLWLALVIDDEINPNANNPLDGHKNPIPLPNLECNILCGNSLMDEFEGIQLINTNEILGTKDETGQQNIFQPGFDSILPKLIDAQDRLFRCSDTNKKEEIKEEITALRDMVIHSQLDGIADPATMEKYEKTKKMASKPFVLWQLDFARVFRDNGGFDIVVGNPPYLRIQGIQQVDVNLAELYKNKFVSATGSFDLYVLFVEKGLQICNFNGIVNFIMPHKWVNSAFGKGLRGKLVSENAMRKMISFGSYQVFNASTYTALFWISKQPNENVLYYEFNYDIENNRQLQSALYNLQSKDYTNIAYDTLSADNWVLTSGKIDKIINKLKQQPYTVKDVFKKIFQGIATSKDSVYFLKDAYEKDGMVYGYSEELEKNIVIENGLAKPLLKGYQIHKYMTGTTDNYTIVPYKLCGTADNRKAVLYTEDELKECFPQGYEYLKECEDVLRQRERGKLQYDEYWYRYIYPKNLNLFDNEKIITPEISLGTNMMYDSGKFYHNTKAYSLVKKEQFNLSYKFYLALLNSNIMWFFLKNTGYVLRGGYYTFKTNYLEPFPLPDVTDEEVVQAVELLVEQSIINVSNEVDNTEIEKQLNRIVYGLYNLTQEEIEFMEGDGYGKVN